MDRYKSFKELASSEEPNAFSIVAVDQHSSICVVAPHGEKSNLGHPNSPEPWPASSLASICLKGENRLETATSTLPLPTSTSLQGFRLLAGATWRSPCVAVRGATRLSISAGNTVSLPINWRKLLNVEVSLSTFTEIQCSKKPIVAIHATAAGLGCGYSSNSRRLFVIG